MIEFKNLAIGYGKTPLHKNFSLSVKKGEFLTIIGPNGAGKSTLLKTIIKELPGIDGAVFLDGKNLEKISLKELAKEVSVLLTVSVKPELMTCRDVVASGRYPHTGHMAFLTPEDNKIIDDAIGLVEAKDFQNKDFMHVSDGQKQRILFARAVCQNPKLLVLDEPTSYLDIKWKFELLAILRSLCEKGVTVIASFHEIELALKISDRIICIGKEIFQLSSNFDLCKKQIKELYSLKGDFFYAEPGYENLVSKFCFRTSEKLLKNKNKNFPKRAKPLMIQGSMSNAGKSFIVAGLCRIFKQDGFSVVPFKSQNMALNSFVTKGGFEMGRAQVMQAEACGIEPSVLMNPVLLKPTSDSGSQVIVNGEVAADMSAKEYFSFKKSLVPEIKKAYETLALKNDVVVIEGAGSPAEINLKENDIVNMGMAEIADSPVLLVADIDRGGVFAQLYGTVALLSDSERARIKGLIINKFRGDKSILDSGIRMIEEKLQIPVVGTVPYIKISLDDEDSLSSNLQTKTFFQSKKNALQIAVIRLPHISNFTDFIPLQNNDFVNLYYVSEKNDLGNPDAVIIPGTKNTFSDLQWLKDSELFGKIYNFGKNGKPVLGICGGFQMLGTEISGKEEENSIEQKVSSLSLLPVKTEFSPKKIRTRVEGAVNCSGGIFQSLNGLKISGYEIHMGESKSLQEENYFSCITDEISKTSKLDGAYSGNIFGTYVHGLFDESEFCCEFIKILAKNSENLDSELKTKILNSNIPAEKKLTDFKESQYNLLAETLRKHLDMEKIYEIMGLKESED